MVAISEHTTQSSRHTTFYLAAGPDRRAVDRIRARLARTRDQLAASVAGFAALGFRADRAGHARLWPLVGVSHARCVCVAVNRRRHDRLDRFVGARTRGVGRARLGQSGRVERREPSSGSLRRSCESVRALLHARARSGSVPRPGRPAAVSADSSRRGSGSTSSTTRRDFARRTKEMDSNPYNIAKLLFRKGDPAGFGQPSPTRWYGATAAGSAAPASRRAARRRRGHRGGRQRVRQRTARNGFFGPELVLHESRTPTRPMRRAP